MILIITYDLKSPRDYTPLYNAIQSLGPWSHYIASTWLVSTEKSPTEAATALRPYMDSQDGLLISEVGGTYAGYLPQPAWEWIAAHKADDEITRRVEELRRALRARAPGLAPAPPEQTLPGVLHHTSPWLPPKK